ncbi:DUF2325 domain-containing protein [Methylohalobius crimeensis]|uniref:DUF2325 domain-containing protein n=1 Tax=Methylohalobius crimeensis TaxID=244365 RepID=UPI0003B58638|nr:DUF2325 domain-containing protein [Methylohalobius crimeensis]
MTASVARLESTTTNLGFPSQRKKLWQLEHRFHCSIAGTCLTLEELRKLCRKARLGVPQGVSDYELHCSFVTLIGKSSPLAKLVQKYLDRKYDQILKEFKKAKDLAALTQLWEKAFAEGDIAGAFWAAVTHPCASESLMFRLFGEIHMLSHLNGASMRIDMQRLVQLKRQVPRLEKEMSQSCREFQRRLQAKDREISQLRHQLDDSMEVKRRLKAAEWRLQHIESGSENNRLCRRLDDAMTSLGKLVNRCERAVSESARWKHAAETAHERERQLKEQLATLSKEHEYLNAVLERFLEEGADRAVGDAAIDLSGRRVLYVGGRHRQWACFRTLVERCRGELICHDGGKEDNRVYLDALLTRADWVLCPLDHVSHDAVRRIKRECRRRGKPFLLLPKASLAAFVEGLWKLVVDEIGPKNDMGNSRVLIPA